MSRIEWDLLNVIYQRIEQMTNSKTELDKKWDDFLTSQDVLLPPSAVTAIFKGKLWAVMLVTRSTAPKQATHSWILDDRSPKGDSNKSLPELIEEWQKYGVTHPGVSHVQSTTVSPYNDDKMLVFWILAEQRYKG